MPIQAWIDDSGAKGQEGYLTLAGFIGASQSWADFSDLWSAELAQEPAIRYFSMREAASLGGEFFRMPPYRRDAKVRRLARIGNSFGFVVISTSVSLASYNETFPKAPPQKKGPNAKRARLFSEQPYFFCFHSMCSAICLEAKAQGAKEEIELLFDEQEIMGWQVSEWYPLFLQGLDEDERAIMPSLPIFRDDKKFMPLQLADLAAWLERADLSGVSHSFGWLKRETRNMRRSLYCRKWDSSDFARLADEARSGRGLTQHGLAYQRLLKEFLGEDA